jgi:fatty-acyl-CoA synthase
MTYSGRRSSSGTVDINVAMAVHRNAHYHRDSVVIRYAGGDFTYGQLNDSAARLATALTHGGVAHGDRVAYLGLNSAAFLVTLLGSLRIGALFVPINHRLAPTEVLTVLERSGAVAAICEEGHRGVVDSVRDRTALKQFVLVDDDPLIAVDGDFPPGWERWSVALAAAAPTDHVAPAHFDEPAILMFTSGTTGRPKGVVLTHGNIWWNSINVNERLDTRRGDTTLATAPLFHVGALNSFAINTIARGGTVVVRRSFEPTQFLEDLLDHSVNSVFAVPAMFNALGRVPDLPAANLSHLRSVVVAGAPVSVSLIRRFADHGIWLQQAWGMTETSPFATHLPVEWTLEKIGSAGIAMPHTEVRVVDSATNQPLSAGWPGEIVVRGPNVTPGYWQDPEATAAAFDDAGWFHSGDIGYLDDDGCLFIVDRLKDMIISGGENVYPAEIEGVLADLPGVTDVAVVGAPHPEWGETVVAVVSVAEEAVVTLEAVREHAASKIARYKLPQQLRIVAQLPRNATGKLDKHALRALISAASPR